ncbi:hypothetical protein, partial [Rhizobium vallis]|uniref:hypothetical protein n=1 Tax=Rhizobium vallis TaxID=634290 RepID=UPI001ABFFF1D
LEKLARCSMLYPPNVDLAAKIRMPTIINFQFLTDMGRMNGQWRSAENPGSSPDQTAVQIVRPSWPH